MEINECIEKVSVGKEEIDKMNARLGALLTKDYKDKNPLFIGLLKGCIPFMADLVRYVDCPCTVSYIKVSSYSGTSSTGNVTFKGEIPDVNGRHVVVVDDIMDTGRTLLEFKKYVMAHGALSVTNCVLLDKPEGRKVDITPDYAGCLVPNEFVVGYGLDYNEQYRNLPYIGVLKKEYIK